MNPMDILLGGFIAYCLLLVLHRWLTGRWW